MTDEVVLQRSENTRFSVRWNDDPVIRSFSFSMELPGPLDTPVTVTSKISERDAENLARFILARVDPEHTKSLDYSREFIEGMTHRFVPYEPDRGSTIVCKRCGTFEDHDIHKVDDEAHGIHEPEHLKEPEQIHLSDLQRRHRNYLRDES